MEYVNKTYLKEIRYTDAGWVQLGVFLRQQINLYFPPYKNGEGTVLTSLFISILLRRTPTDLVRGRNKHKVT
jgi:hypothetical protein